MAFGRPKRIRLRPDKAVSPCKVVCHNFETSVPVRDRRIVYMSQAVFVCLNRIQKKWLSAKILSLRARRGPSRLGVRLEKEGQEVILSPARGFHYNEEMKQHVGLLPLPGVQRQECQGLCNPRAKQQQHGGCKPAALLSLFSLRQQDLELSFVISI